MQIDGAISNLLQGVSQQPMYSRQDGQCTEQVNAVADVVAGCTRRPPTEFIKALSFNPGPNAKWHFYDTGAEQYFLCISLSAIGVFNLAGTMLYSSAPFSYLTSSNPEDLSLVTIGDYTIISNKNVLPAMAVGFKEAYLNSALVYLKDGGEYGRKYTISIDGVLCASYTSPGGSTPATDAEKTGTEYVANALYNQLISGGAGAGAPEVLLNYSFRIAGSIIEIARGSGTGNIDVTATDDRGGQFAKVIQRAVGKAGDLPKFATPSQVVQVTGEGTSDKDDLYLKFVIEHGSNTFGTEGVWRECSSPAIETKLNTQTLPHALIRMPDSTWRFTALDGASLAHAGGTLVVEHWRLRSSGDAKSNPEPSFIGKPINAVGAFQDRLYLLTSESAVFSSSGSYFNFFNKTATAILDSDPCDLPSAGNQIVDMQYAVQVDRNLVIFADKSQFIVPGNKVLVPKSSMLLTTSYESDLHTSPVTAGAGVLFPITYGAFSGIREFSSSEVTDTNKSQPLTAHVPKYIKGTIAHMACSSNFDTVLVQSSAGKNSLYVYEYLYADNEKLQAAWGRWDFRADCTVVYMFIKDAFVYLVLRVGLAYYLERIDLTDSAPGLLEHNVYLDSRCVVPVVGTSLVLPYTPTAGLMVIQGDGCAYPGSPMEIESIVGAVVTLKTAPGASCYAGLEYNTKYAPTMPFVKDQKGAAITTGRLNLGFFKVSYRDTGGFTALVKNPHYEDFAMEFSGRVLGAFTNIVGEPAVSTGALEVPVRKDVKDTSFEIHSRKHLPLSIVAIEWTGDWTKRGRRV